MAKIADIGSSATLDSLQVRIPLASVDNYADSLTHKTFLVSETGEVLEERTTNRLHLTKDSALSFQVKKVRHSGRENIPCLQIMATSKLLGQRYFDGINRDTFQILYDAIQREGLVDLRREVLLSQGLATDVDIKIDAYLPSHVDFTSYTKQLELDCKVSSKIGEGCKRYNNRDQGQGIQFGTRKTATVGRPFLKVYNKQLELLTKSQEFSREHLRGHNTDGLVRTEVTMKNKQAFKRVWGTSNSSLGNLLSLSPSKLKDAVTYAGNAHLSKITKYRSRTSNDLSGQQLTIYNSLTAFLEMGMCLEDASEIMLAGHEKKSKQRTKSLIKDLYSRYQLEGENLSNEYDFGFSLFGVE